MKRFLILTTSFVCIDTAAIAQTVSSSNGLENIDEIIVTATRSPQRLDRIASSISVLDAAAIESSQAIVVSDLLAQTPGVTFSRTGGIGSTTSVYIRGAEADQTVVVIDGVKINDPSQPGSGFDFSNLLIGDITRIEVLRGPQSTLWGSEAIGGVINIVTTEPTKPFEAQTQIEGGSYSTTNVDAGVGGKTDRLSWRVAGNYYNTVGISALDPAFGGTIPDGYHSAGASGRFDYDLTPNVQLDQRVYYVKARNDFDGFPPPLFELAYDGEYGQTSEFIDYTGMTFDLFGGMFKNRVSFQYTDTDRNYYEPSLSVQKTFEGIGRNTRLEYQGTLDIVDGYQAIFGAQHERSAIKTDSPSPFDPTPVPLKAATTIDSGYGQIQGEVIHGLTLTGGLRYDKHDIIGGHVSAQTGAAWSLNNGSTILRATFGQGFKAPALYQLFSQYGNPNLRPELSNGWDAGVEQHLWDGRVTASATYFSRSSRDLIQFFFCDNSDPLCATRPFGYYANIARAKASGVELQTTAVLAKNLNLSANYTYTDTQDQSPGSGTFGNELPRRPKSTANASLNYLWSFDLTTTVAVRYAGLSFDDAANTIPLHAYTLVDLRASYPVNKYLEIYGRIENLTDAHYETAYMYGMPGRAVYGGVRARF